MRAGLVADHVHHRQQVLVVDRPVALVRAPTRTSSESGTSAPSARAQRELEELGELALALGGQRHAHRHLVLRCAVVQRRHVRARRAPCASSRRRRAARRRRARPCAWSTRSTDARRGVLDRVVDADDVGRGGERLAHLLRDADAARPRRGRRPRRRSARAPAAPAAPRPPSPSRPSAARSPRARGAPPARSRGSCGGAASCRRRFTCRSPCLGGAAQVVLAHQAVEVDRRGEPGVGLVVGDLGHGRRDARPSRAAPPR